MQREAAGVPRPPTPALRPQGQGAPSQTPNPVPGTAVAPDGYPALGPELS